jgi:hypothetical protein
MKTTRLTLIVGLCLLFIGAAKAQVKIGDNPLNIGDDRMYEIERAGKLLIVTDSLEFGITTSQTTNNPNTDALMLRLYGYGLGNFTGAQNFFLGTNTLGDVMEFPLSLNLVSNSSSATLSLNNGTTTFGSVSLNPLDSIFATNTQLTDSLNTVRTLLAESDASDGDTITGNEWIANIAVTSPDTLVRLTFTENVSGIGPTHTSTVLIGPFVVTDKELGDTLTTIRNELADTAQALRNSLFYTSDGGFDEDRTVAGNNFSLNWNNIDSFNINNNNFTLNTTGTTDVTSGGDISVSSTSGDISVTGGDISSSATGTNDVTATGDITIASGANVNISGDSLNLSGPMNNNSYGTGANSGSETFILGTDASGNIIEVSLDSIGGDATLSSPTDIDEDGTLETTVDEAIQAANREIDSTIYNYNGTLTSNRYMTMATRNLYFVDGSGNDTTVITSDGRMAIGRGTVTPALMAGREIKLDVNGDILAMQIHSSSDKRFKKNIVQVDNALEKVMAINGVNYDFRIDEFKDRNFPTTRQLGFIAQNVEAVVPEVVKTNGDGYKSVDYAKLTALLNEAIKEQQAQIEKQSSLIAQQQNILSALVEQNAQLSAEVKQIKNATSIKVAEE